MTRSTAPKRYSPETLTAFMRRLGTERARLRPERVVRVLVSPEAHTALEELSKRIYGRELAAVVDVAVLADDSCDRAEVRCETF
jgi:hypothetical protein